jgi:hypothetical protein
MHGPGIVMVAAALALAGAPAFAQGVAPGGGIGGSTAIGSGLGGVGGTGPSWPNGTNQAPQPSIQSVPPGGYASPAPSSTYTSPSASTAPRPSTGGTSSYPQPGAPYPASSVRPPATLPLVMPEKPNGSLVFLKGCWRSDIFTDGPRKATLTWCFDDRGGGRYLYSRTDQGSFYCHGRAQARWDGPKLNLSSANPTCDDPNIRVPGTLVCSDATDGALCTGAGTTPTVRLFRVR